MLAKANKRINTINKYNKIIVESIIFKIVITAPSMIKKKQKP